MNAYTNRERAAGSPEPGRGRHRGSLRSARRGRLLWTGLGGALALLAVLGSAAPLPAQRADRLADLRCLTSKQEHCLEQAMSEAEPHRAICATCHNVWTQQTTAAAAGTCASSGCHERPDTVTPFHRGLSVQVRRDCIGCHPAHDARIPAGGNDCTFCHASGGQFTKSATGRRQPGRIVLIGRTASQDRLFRHAQHRQLECTSCHSNEKRHGGVAVRAQDCQSCHHPGQKLTASCTSCHIVKRESPARLTRR